MFLAVLAQVPDSSIPDARLLFLLSIATVVAVTAFAVGVIIVLMRRIYQRRLDEQRMMVIGTTTARLLHQIKNPVQSLLLQAELLQEFERDDAAEARREASAAIIGEANRLASMLAELSAWAAGTRRSMVPEGVELHDLLTELVGQGAAPAQRRGVRLEAQVLTETLVAADAYYFRQAIENLIRNAIEATAGQEDARVSVALEPLGTRAAVHVIDNGPGIPKKQLKSIFEPFVTTKSSGMGLGLVIAKEIVEQHGGEMQVHSAPGEGTTFTILMPVQMRSGRAVAETAAGAA